MPHSGSLVRRSRRPRAWRDHRWRPSCGPDQGIMKVLSRRPGPHQRLRQRLGERSREDGSFAGVMQGIGPRCRSRTVRQLEQAAGSQSGSILTRCGFGVLEAAGLSLFRGIRLRNDPPEWRSCWSSRDRYLLRAGLAKWTGSDGIVTGAVELCGMTSTSQVIWSRICILTEPLTGPAIPP